MINTYRSGVLSDAKSWSILRDLLGGSRQQSLLNGLLRKLRDAGGIYYILESAYIDRDYAKAYSAFYYRTHYPHHKYCKRLHVFSADLSAIEGLDTQQIPDALQNEGQDHYVGCVVLRPLAHAPVSWAVVAHKPSNNSELLVRSTFTFHLLGAEFSVVGMPVTEQDARTGACAQAAIWSAARHFYNRGELPWSSIVDITAGALTPTDVENFRSLPAGSEFLTTDAMVRAMKTVGLHPFVYEPDDSGAWFDDPHRIIGRYLDSGIPVIIGLQSDEGGQPHSHAVVAVGTEGRHRSIKLNSDDDDDDDDDDETDQASPESQSDIVEAADHAPDTSAAKSEPGQASSAHEDVSLHQGSSAQGSSGQRNHASTKAPTGPTIAELHTHILVNDDQRGCYRRLAISAKAKAKGVRGEWSLEDATFIMPSLPDTVFISAEAAEALARQRIADVVKNRAAYERRATGAPKARASTDKRFYAQAKDLMARTYLTQGWKYQRRMLRNRVSKAFRNELMRIHLPKHVWVTEFGFPDELDDANPCNRRIRAHVVIDATGSDFWESTIFTHAPGLLMTNAFDPYMPDAKPELLMYASPDDEPYLPKVRGWPCYGLCEEAAAG